MSEEKLNYCVGRPFLDDPNSLNIYMHGNQVKYGTIEEARIYRNFVNTKSGKQNFIYEVVKIPNQ